MTPDCKVHGSTGRNEPCVTEHHLADRRREEREDRGHGFRRLAIEPVGVALAHPDDVGKTVVPDLDDDRRDDVPPAVIRSGDPEGFPQAELEHLLANTEAHGVSTHGSASTPSRMARHSRSAPNRTGSSAGRPVSAAIDSMTRRASPSSG